MDAFKYLIIGGGLAGGRACQGIRRVDSEGTVALVSAEMHPPYERPPLSKGYLTGKEGLEHVYFKDDAFYRDNGITLLLGALATRLDRSMRSVSLADGRVLRYERLLLATGGRAWQLPIPGSDLEGVHTLRTIGDSDAIRSASGSGSRAVVIGGSFVGSEVAASLTQLGSRVVMVFRESRLLHRTSPQELSDHIEAKYREQGIRLLSGTTASEIKGDGRVRDVMLAGGEVLEADLIVMGVGIRLNVDLAREAGLAISEDGGVLVDESLCTSDPDIYAAGDIAAWPDPTFGRRLRVEHWDVARSQGYRAGANMAGEAKPYTTLPYFFSDLFDLSFEVWGDLTAWDTTALRGSLQEGSFAFYYFCEGKLVGVLASGRPGGERKAMQALVKLRPNQADIASKLVDETMDLSTLVG